MDAAFVALALMWESRLCVNVSVCSAPSTCRRHSWVSHSWSGASGVCVKHPDGPSCCRATSALRDSLKPTQNATKWLNTVRELWLWAMWNYYITRDYITEHVCAVCNTELCLLSYVFTASAYLRTTVCHFLVWHRRFILKGASIPAVSTLSECKHWNENSYRKVFTSSRAVSTLLFPLSFYLFFYLFIYCHCFHPWSQTLTVN